MLTFVKEKFGLSLICLVLCSSSALAQDVAWQTDLATANSLAAKQGKFVWLHFTADWCRPCKSLETFVFSSSLLQDTIDKNVIPVKVDVDLQTDLVSEYGISGVPADVIITPAGRVITQRNSPSTIDDYAKMFKGLGKSLAGMDREKTGLAKDLAELQEHLQPKNLAGQNDFVPPAPSHEAPRLTTDGVMLAMNNQRVLKNPFVQPEAVDSIADTRVDSSDASTSSNSVVIKNDFAPASPRNASLVPLEPSNQVAQAEIKIPLASDQQTSAFSTQRMAQRDNQTGAAMAKIQNQPIANQFFEREVVSGQQAQETVARASNQFEPAQTAYQVKPSLNSTRQTDPVEFDRSKFAMHGKCPVTLMTESKWVDGDPHFGCVHRGRTYLFVSKAHLRTFQSDPDKYSPLLAGYDPVVYHERGDLVEGQEVHGVFMGQLPNQRIVLFSSAETRAKFENVANTKNYIETVRQAMLSTKSGAGSELR